MAEKPHEQRELSARRIVGFACNQAFIYFLFYTGVNRVLVVGEASVVRFDLLATLLFMIVGFAVVRTLGSSGIERVFSRPLLYMYAVIAAAGSLLQFAFPSGEAHWIIAQAALTGVSLAYLLTAWGRAFGREPTATSVPEVFLGSLVGALVCLVFSFGASSDLVQLAARVLPLASVVNIEVPPSDEVLMPTSVDKAEGRVKVLSAKILVGTLLFGFAAGLVETTQVMAVGNVAEGMAASGAVLASFNAGGGGAGFASPAVGALGGQAVPAVASVPYLQTGLVLFGAFLVGGLSLLLSDGFGRGEALNKSYRLAVFVMLFGMLLAPWPLLSASVLPGEAVVFAGYLGLEVVLVSLFIVVAKITAIDCALSFSAGFTLLFAGEFAGVLAGNAFAVWCVPDAQYPLLALAGAAVLVAYLFLFTDRDFNELSEIATVSDAFEDACDKISAQYGLSNREGEILAFALRGRTSERIAQELVISKSTVDTHLRRIYAKCGVHSRQELLDLGERFALK